MYKQLQTASQTWVMLYGVGYRKIDLMRATEVAAYYRRIGRTRVFHWRLRQLHLLRFARWLMHKGIWR